MVSGAQIGGGIILIVIGVIMITAVLIPVTVQQVASVNSSVQANTRTILGLYELFEALMGLVMIAGGGFLAYSGAKQ